MARDGGLFKGAEFTRLVILLGVMVVGWPMILLHGLSQKDAAPPPPPPTLAGASALPPPDDAIELKGVIDKAPISIRDDLAYSLLFKQARETPEKLHAEARRDVVFSQVVERPARFRGMPIHLDLTARRITLQDEIRPEVTPKKRFYEAWAFSKDSQNYPYVIAFEDAPNNLPVGNDIFARFGFDGYFFKLIAYQDGSNKDGKPGFRYAPLLVGRITSYTPPSTASASSTGYDLTWQSFVMIVLGAASLYALVRIVTILRRQFSTPITSSLSSKPSDQIEPEDLSRFLHGDPVEVTEVLEEEGPPSLRG